MSRARLSSYDELAQLLRDLPTIVRANRRRLGLSLREAAQLLGLSPSTLSRVEAGEDFNTGTLVVLLQWLGER